MSSFRLLPLVALSLFAILALRGFELWTGYRAVAPAVASDASATGHDAPAPPPAHEEPSHEAPSHEEPTHEEAGDGSDHGIPPIAAEEPAPESHESSGTTVAVPQKPERPKIPGEEDFISPSEIEVLESLTHRRETLDQRAAELDMREQLLAATEQRLDQKLADIKAIQDELKFSLRLLDEQEEAQIASLVKVYETMKPKDAADIFQDLDRTILIDVAARMKEQKMAQILAAMDPAKARELTVLLAKRNEIPGGGETVDGSGG